MQTMAQNEKRNKKKTRTLELWGAVNRAVPLPCPIIQSHSERRVREESNMWRVEKFSKQMTDINPQSYKSKTQQTRSVKIWFLKTTKTGKYLMRQNKLKGEKVKINYTRNENRKHNYRDLKHGRTLREIFHLKKWKIWLNVINLTS